MRVAILPSGALLADTAPGDDEASDGLSVAARARIARAFRRGPGHALLDLGATELDAALAPPLAFLRDLGRAFVTRLCAVPDLEERRERVEVDCPADERTRLAGAVPPMPGGEYVNADWVAARWADLNRAFAAEIRAHRGPVVEWLSARHHSWHTVGKVCVHLAENRGGEEHPFAFLATYAVRVGEKKPSAVGMDALLDFSVAVALGDEKLTAAEVRQLLASSGGLVRLRGQWVELDRERLREVLAHWERVRREAKEGGLSFLEGMRLLAGAARTEDDAAALAAGEGWSRVEAGLWLARTLEGLRGPAGLAATDPGADFRGTLRPYQKVGVSWLAFASSLRLGVCLADDMGLGKTIQVLGLLLVTRRVRAGDPPHLLVAPASLLANWQAEIERFAPSLATLVAHPSTMPARELAELGGADLGSTDLVMTTYGTLARVEALRSREWSLAILDEAQAIKNPGARQTQAVKALKARARIALAGPPVEDRLGDLWSIYDFLDPGLLGSAREFPAFAKRLADRPDESYAPLRRLIQPYLLRRLKTDRSILADLPDKTEVKAFCLLSGPQAALY